jgi:hypothetical protein
MGFMADEQTALRDELIFHLTVGHAHMPLEDAVKDFPMDRINEEFPNGSYSAWALLEHIRISQWDILDFIRNKDYIEIEWPKDYWPAPGTRATSQQWQATLDAFIADRQALIEIVNDPATDLYAKISWGTGQTVMREILVVTDHNAYHVGEFAIMRQAMATWGPGHE